MIHRTRDDIIVEALSFLVLTVVMITVFFPFYYTLVISFNEGFDAKLGGVYLWPRKPTLDNYRAVFSNRLLTRAFIVSTARTVVGTVFALTLTGMYAYSLSQRGLMLRRLYIGIVLFSMFFSGGLIPRFLLLKFLGLYNSFWVYIIPHLATPFNVIIMMSFFRELPSSIQESARMDGANDLTIFVRLVLPLSTPVFATIALFVGVFHWNQWFDTAFFTRDSNLRTVSYILIDLINRVDLSTLMVSDAMDSSRSTQTYTSETIRTATMMVVIAPIVMLYPFLQRYFIKGVMVGSVKG